MSNSLTYRSDIDGLRAAAVLAVIAYHAYPSIVPGGFVGVDIFFVISGFLISSLILKGLQTGDFRFTEFYARRIRRIFPALTLVLITTLSVGWYLLLTDEYIQLGKHTLGSAAFGPNFVFLKEVDYFDRIAELKPLLHLWSLGIEEQFYILWPFALVLLWRRRPILSWAIFLVVLGSFGVNIYYLAHAEPSKSFYLPQARCWELLIGAALAYLTFYHNAQLSRMMNRRMPFTIHLPHLISAVGVVCIAIALVSLDKEAPFPGWWALLPVIGAFSIIIAGPEAWINRCVLAHPAAVFVGLISYPLYLWHWPLLAFAQIATENDFGTLPKAGVLAVSFLLSTLTYYFWERPLRKSQAPWNLAALILLMVVVGVSGRLIQKQHGYPGRFPASIQRIVNTAYSDPHRKSYRSGTCFVNKDGPKLFSDKCLEPASAAGKKIFLWGDSHAAHLYPGLQRYEHQGGYRVIQFTTSGCPPIMAIEIPKRPSCKATNERIIELIGQTHPDIVLMAAYWTASKHVDLDKLSLTISSIKKLNIQKIIFMGPVPSWSLPLPQLLVRFSKRNNWNDPPDRLPLAFVGNTSMMDEQWSTFAEKNQVAYISSYRTFCNLDGCLAKIAGEPVAFDARHLTNAGSSFLIKSNLRKILDFLPSPSIGPAAEQRP